MSKKRLTREQTVQRLQAKWNRQKTKGAPLSVMEKFLDGFYTSLAAEFDVEISLKHLRGLFMVSKSQACLHQDIFVNKVEFKAKAGASLEPSEDDNDFDKLSCKFFERILKRQLWYTYSNMEGMFHGVQRKNRDINCQGISLRDILQRLLIRDVVQIRHIKLKKQKREAKHGVQDTLVKNFITHLNSLGVNRPQNRNALIATYENFLQNMPNKPANFDNIAFTDITDQLKARRIIKFSSGSANVIYLKQKHLATDQHFGRRQQKNSKSNQAGEQSTHREHAGGNTKNAKQQTTLNKDITRYFVQFI